MGKYDDVTSVDDEILEGFSLDARKMFVAAAEEKRQSVQAAQDWQAYIDERINRHLAPLVEELEGLARDVGKDLREVDETLNRKIDEKVERRPKVIIFDPSESLKKLVTEFSSDLREELTEIRKELGLRRKGEVLDLPTLPTRKRA